MQAVISGDANLLFSPPVKLQDDEKRRARLWVDVTKFFTGDPIREDRQGNIYYDEKTGHKS